VDGTGNISTDASQNVPEGLAKELSAVNETDAASPPSLGFQEFLQKEKPSSLIEYQNLIVGSRSFWYLCKYELAIMLLANLNGAAGLVLRRMLYKSIFKELGKGTVIGTGVTLRQPGKIAVGRSCIIDDHVGLAVRGSQDSEIRLTRKVLVCRSTILNARDGVLEIGDQVSIGSCCRISAYKGTIRIGKYSMIGAYSYIGVGNHKIERKDVPMALQDYETCGGITIEEDVWIGARALISDGVTIGRGSIIGAASYVNKDIPEYSVAYGCPAKVVRKR